MRVWWDKRLKVMRVSTIAIITTLIILLFFAGFTIYGNKVGNFVINVDLRNGSGTVYPPSRAENFVIYSNVKVIPSFLDS